MRPIAATRHKTEDKTMKIKELDRINTLARLSRSRVLTAAETAERNALRRRYLAAIRGQPGSLPATATVLDPEGRDVTPGKLRAAQAAGVVQYT